MSELRPQRTRPGGQGILVDAAEHVASGRGITQVSAPPLRGLCPDQGHLHQPCWNWQPTLLGAIEPLQNGSPLTSNLDGDEGKRRQKLAG